MGIEKTLRVIYLSRTQLARDQRITKRLLFFGEKLDKLDELKRENGPIAETVRGRCYYRPEI